MNWMSNFNWTEYPLTHLGTQYSSILHFRFFEFQKHYCLLSHWEACCQKEQLGESLHSGFLSRGQLNHIITHYFPLQGALHSLVHNSYCGMDRHLRQSHGERSGSILMKYQWKQSWWEIGKLMAPAVLSSHSLPCPAVSAQAEVQSLASSTGEWVDGLDTSSTSLITAQLSEGAIVSCRSSLR